MIEKWARGGASHSGAETPAPRRFVPRMRMRVPLLVALVAIIACMALLLQPRSSNPAAASALAPDFSLPAISGARGPISLSALRGHPVVLNFFNSHCAPCLDELPELRRASAMYTAAGVVFVGVATGGDTVSSARALVEAAHLRYRVALDANQAVAWRYYVGGWPTSFFIDARGNLRGEYVGPLDDGSLRSGLAQVGAVACVRCAPLPQAALVTDQPTSASAPVIDADTLYDPAKPAPSFALLDQNGHVVTPASLRGRVVALTFLSSVCVQQCPLVGKSLTLARGMLGKDANRLAIVAISVSPEQDSPAATQHFASASGWQGSEWHYLTAPRDVLAPVWRQFGVYVAAAAPIFKNPQSVVHQAEVFLIDPYGKLCAFYDVPFLPARAASTIRALLQ